MAMHMAIGQLRTSIYPALGTQEWTQTVCNASIQA